MPQLMGLRSSISDEPSLVSEARPSGRTKRAVQEGVSQREEGDPAAVVASSSIRSRVEPVFGAQSNVRDIDKKGHCRKELKPGRILQSHNLRACSALSSLNMK